MDPYSSVRLHRGSWVNSNFKYSHKFSIWLRSELWLRLSRTVILLSLHHFCEALTVWYSGHCHAEKKKSSPKLQFSCRLHQAILQDFPILCYIHFILYLYKTSRACKEATPQHAAATTMLQCLISIKVENFQGGWILFLKTYCIPLKSRVQS